MTTVIDRRDILIGAGLVTGAAIGGGLGAAVAQAQPLRVRPALHTPEGQKQVLSYRNAVEVMRQRSPLDPTSWTYQALIHGIVMRIPKEPFIQFVMFRDVPDIDPARQLADACWATCPHSRIEFLPWHRIYIYFFERIVRDASGDSDFMLPYWDYSSSGNDVLPLEFREPVGASPLDNPLYNNARDPHMNGVFGPPASLEPTDVALSALREPLFEETTTRVGFSNALENVPHNVIHGAVGGSDDVGFPVGDMSSTNTAGRDPIFWMHHANIDRLWESWLRAGGETTAGNYADREWYTANWTFVDETGARRDVSLADLDALLASEPIEYDRYEEIPRDAPPEIVVVGGPPEQLTASVALSAQGHRFEFPTFSAESVEPEGNRPVSAQILISGVESAVQFGITFDVYFNLQDGADVSEAKPVGSFNLFGTLHEGMAMKKRFTFDVGDQVRAAIAAGTWPSVPSVTILPRKAFVGSPVTVGRVELVLKR